MSEFVQIHMLTSYPPANVNRDDLGRPKTATLGGENRLRISSQCLKRTWRTSQVYQEAISDNKGYRTREFGTAIKESLTTGTPLPAVISDTPGGDDRETVESDTAEEWTEQIAGQFGDLDGIQHTQLVFVTPEEIQAVDDLLEVLIAEGREPEDEELDVLRDSTRAVDVAMFGRMMADTPEYSIEGAVQVGHALTTHDVVVEDDYFSAVEDLNQYREDAGAAHLGEREFASGVFYLYTCVNRTQLEHVLEGRSDLAGDAIKALVKAMAKETPPGMKNSYGSSTFASYALVEKGSQQPRNFSSIAFLEPVQNGNYMEESINRIREALQNLSDVYGGPDNKEMNAVSGEGSLEELANYAGQS